MNNLHAQFDALISASLTNGEVDQMEQDATDAHVAYQVERIQQWVKAVGESRKRFGER